MNRTYFLFHMANALNDSKANSAMVARVFNCDTEDQRSSELLAIDNLTGWALRLFENHITYYLHNMYQIYCPQTGFTKTLHIIPVEKEVTP